MVSPDASGSQYFADSPAVASNRRSIELVLPDTYLSLTTDTGVFSASAVDKGTRFLLREHPPISALTPPPRTIVDLGCGYGPIALTAARRAPDARVVGVDVNERALGLARENADANEIANAEFHAPDAALFPDGIDLIVSNPPIRIGKRALRELLELWLDRLNPTGRAWLVVQKHLGSDSLASWLNDHGWPTTRLGSRSGFRILEVVPRPLESPE